MKELAMSCTFEETKQALEFNVVSHKRAYAHSPLFYLITELLKDASDPLHRLLIAANIKKIAEDSAFLLSIASSTKHTPLSFSGYRFSERHYRFDQFYKTNIQTQHGLSPLHYTETYMSDVPGMPDIVIHVYLTIQGHILYVDSSKPLSIQEEKIIENNVAHSKSIVSKLIDENNQRLLNVLAAANESEANLKSMSLSLNTPNELARYIDACNRFTQEIAQVNLYSENPDPRAVSIFNTLPSLNKRLELLKKLSKPLRTDKPIEHLNEPANTETTANIGIIELDGVALLIKDTIQNLKQYLERLNLNKTNCPTRCINNPNLDEISQTYPLLEEIKQYLLIALCLPLEIDKKTMNSINEAWKTLQNKITEYDKYYLNVLMTAAKNGNISIFEPLFFLIEQNIPENFYEQLLDALIECRKKSKVDSLIKTCEFLNTHSVLYKMGVFKFCKERKYPKSFQDMNRLLSRSAFEADVEISTLCKLYLENHFSAFEILLKHGANANSWSFQYAKSTIKNYTLFYMAAIFRTLNYSQYFSTLLKYGANPNLKLYEDIKKMRFSLDLKDTIQAKKLAKPHQPIAILNQTHDKGGQVLSILESLNASDELELLLPYTNADILALVLSDLINMDIFITRINTSTHPILRFVGSLEEANTILPTVVQKESFMGFVIYPNTSKDTTSNLFKNKSMYVQKILECLQEKVNPNLLSELEFEQGYELLFDSGVCAKIKDKTFEAYVRFLACEFMITARLPLLNTENQYTLLTKHTSELSSKLIEVSRQLYNKILSTAQLQDKLAVWAIRALECQRMQAPPQSPTVLLSVSETKEQKEMSVNKKKGPKKKKK